MTTHRPDLRRRHRRNDRRNLFSQNIGLVRSRIVETGDRFEEKFKHYNATAPTNLVERGCELWLNRIYSPVWLLTTSFCFQTRKIHITGGNLSRMRSFFYAAMKAVFEDLQKKSVFFKKLEYVWVKCSELKEVYVESAVETDFWRM